MGFQPVNRKNRCGGALFSALDGALPAMRSGVTARV